MNGQGLKVARKDQRRSPDDRSGRARLAAQRHDHPNGGDEPKNERKGYPGEHGESPGHEKARRGLSRRGRNFEHHLCQLVYHMFRQKSSPDRQGHAADQNGAETHNI